MGKIMYLIGKVVFSLYFLIIYHWQITGKNNRPDRGSLVVMANHVSALDPPIVGCVMNRQVHFMAKEELFSHPAAAWVFNQIGVFPVKRGRPDRRAIKQAFKVLKDRKVLGIFPEGTRHRPGKPGRAQSGAVMIPIRSRTPILPVGIKFVGKKLQVAIGEPFSLDDYYDRKLSREELKEAGEVIMEKIKLQVDSI